MFLYKILKVLKNNLINIFVGTLSLSIICSVGSLSGVFFSIYSNDFSKVERKYLALFSLIFTCINLFFVYLVDINLNSNVIISIFLGYFISFLFFMPFSFIFLTLIEYGQTSLDSNEIRDAKINKVLGKFF